MSNELIERLERRVTSVQAEVERQGEWIRLHQVYLRYLKQILGQIQDLDYSPVIRAVLKHLNSDLRYQPEGYEVVELKKDGK
jgi:hypothetical protein